MNESPRTRLFAYGLALLAPAVTLLVRWPLEAVFGERVLYMAFIPAILFVAYIGGLWPGLITTALGALAATSLLISPGHSFGNTMAPNAVALSLLLLIGAIISVLSESLHRTWRRLLTNERRRSAGGVASDVEDLAAQGQLEEARPLIGQLETIAQELITVVDGLSLEALQHRAGAQAYGYP